MKLPTPPDRSKLIPNGPFSWVEGPLTLLKENTPTNEFLDTRTGKRYEWGRTRWQDGTYRADDPSTEDEDEAWGWIEVK